MTTFSLSNEEKLDFPVRELIAELEKANQDLHVEILECKQAETKLISICHQLSEVLESINDGFYALDQDWNLTYVNHQAASYLGLKQEDLIGQHLWEKCPHLVGTYLETSFRKAMQEGQQQAFETHTVFTEKWHHFRVYPSREGISVIFKDITERKQSEEALKEAYNTLEEKVKERTSELKRSYDLLKESERNLAEAQEMAHIGNWHRNLITNEVYWSDEVYRIFGLKPQESGITYGTFLSRVHPEDRELLSKATKKALKGKLSSTDYGIVVNNGEERTVHEEVKVVFDENNIPVHLRGTVQDITERKKTEKALVNLETARQKEIHHRIKNNLQVISSLLDLQAEKFNEREYIENSEVFEAFKESQNRVQSISLIHEKLYEGEETDELDFSLYLQKLVENFFRTYRLGNIDIGLKVDLEEKIFVDMDTAVPLGMIANELISNSFKYAFPGRETGEIRIKLLSEEAENRENNKDDLARKCMTYTLTVSDNGIGIPENIDFKNPDTLGLQLVNTLVDQLYGEVELKRGNGTEFIIRFSEEEKRDH